MANEIHYHVDDGSFRTPKLIVSAVQPKQFMSQNDQLNANMQIGGFANILLQFGDGGTKNFLKSINDMFTLCRSFWNTTSWIW